MHVERANLDFDISHLIIRAILSELLKFKVELPCFKMSKISIKRHIKLKFSLLAESGVTRALMGGGGVYSYIRVLPDGFLLK